eukprot:7360298-Prymnesium_polylepis.2
MSPYVYSNATVAALSPAALCGLAGVPAPTSQSMARLPPGDEVRYLCRPRRVQVGAESTGCRIPVDAGRRLAARSQARCEKPRNRAGANV